jgi:hypothetical protein
MEEQTQISLSKDNVVKMPDDIEGAIITNITIKPAQEIFGDKAKNKEQVVLYIEFKSEEYGVEGNEVMTYFKDKIPERSKLGKFLNRYDKLEKGIKVKLERDTNSDFYKIRI